MVWAKYVRWAAERLVARDLNANDTMSFQGLPVTHCVFCGVCLQPGMIHPIPEKDQIRLSALDKLTYIEKVALGLAEAE
jgi:hypothetical protein